MPNEVPLHREAVLLSVFGRINYKRRYYTCSSCKKGLYPLDKRLHLAAGEVTAGLAELLALAGIETAFAESSRFIERFLLFQISDNTLRKETERFGQLQKAIEEKWKQQSSEYLPPVAEAAFGKDTPEYFAWLEQARSQLWEGQIDDLIHDCQILSPIPLANKPVHDAVSYFTHKHKRMDYARFRQLGYFIGSGTVESAGK